MRQVDPMTVMQAHAHRVARCRTVYSLARPLLRRSRFARRALGRLFRISPAYLEHDAPVSIHGADQRWTPGQPRLVVVTHELSASGAPRIVGEIVRIFGKADWFVTVVASTDGPARESIRQHAALVIDPAALNEGSSVLAALAPVTELGFANTVVCRVAVIALADATPVFWYLHEVSLLEEMLRNDPRVARALGAARRVFAGSELSARLARQHRQDIRVLPYGLKRLVIPETISEPGTQDVVRIAIFGAIEPRKGQDLAVGALALLSEPERLAVHLTLYGRVLDQPFTDRLDATIRATTQVAWGGELDADAYAAAMWAADIVLVSSRDDTLPLVSLDALGAGRVLICTATTGTSAWIEDGTSGFVASSADATAQAAALSRALARRADWTEIGRAGRLLFDANFSEQAFSAALLAEADAAIDE